MAKTYKVNGKEYDFDRLKSDADYKLPDYLYMTKEGRELADDIKAAYNDMMTGLADGSIIIENGRFKDTSNTRKNNTIYGIAANHIYTTHLGLPEYIDPTKIQAGKDDSFGKGYLKYLFGQGDGSAFMDLDDETSGIINRVNAMKLASKEMRQKLDSTYLNLDLDTRSKYIGYLDSLDRWLEDDLISKLEAYEASKIGFNLGSLLTKKTATTTPTTPTTTLEVTAEGSSTAEEASASTLDFDTWYKSKFGVFDKKLSYSKQFIAPNTRFFRNTTLDGWRYLTSKLIKPSTLKDLTFLMIGNYLNNKNSAVIKRDGRFSKFFTDWGSKHSAPFLYLYDDSYYLAMFVKAGIAKNLYDKLDNDNYAIYVNKKQGAAIIWNNKTNTLSRVDMQSVPKLKEALNWSYNKSITTHKEGGILKFLNAGKVPSKKNNIWATLKTTGNPIAYNDSDYWILSPEYIAALNELSPELIENLRTAIGQNVDDRDTNHINDWYGQSADARKKVVFNLGVKDFNSRYQNNGIVSANNLLFGADADAYTKKQGVADRYFNLNRVANPVTGGSGDSPNTNSAVAYTDGYNGGLTALRVFSLTNKDYTTDKFGEWGNWAVRKGFTHAYYRRPTNNSESEFGQWVPLKDGEAAPNGETIIPILSAAYKTPTEIKTDDGKTNEDPGSNTGGGNTGGKPREDDTKENNTWINTMLGSSVPVKDRSLNQLFPKLFIGSERLPLTLKNIADNRDILHKGISEGVALKLAKFSSRPIEGRYNLVRSTRQNNANTDRELINQFGSDSQKNKAELLTKWTNNLQTENKALLLDDERKFQTRNEDLKLRETTAQSYLDAVNKNREVQANARRDHSEVDASSSLAKFNAIDAKLRELDSTVLDYINNKNKAQDAATEAAIATNWDNLNKLLLDEVKKYINNYYEAHKNDPSFSLSNWSKYLDLLELRQAMENFAANMKIYDLGRARGIKYDTNTLRTWKDFSKRFEEIKNRAD